MSKYSIEQFSEITGLNKILIRTWENRYNFIEPKRTSTNIRYYDDTMLVKGIKYSILVKNGYKISKLVNHNEKHISQLIEETLKITSNLNKKNDIYISKFLESAILFNQLLFDKTYKSCIKNLGIVNFYKDVLIKTMNQISILFLNSKITPANEHFLSENIRVKIGYEIEKIKNKTLSRKKWVLFLPENEYHDIGLLFTHLILKIKNYKVIYLGQNVPRENLLSFNNKDTNLFFFLNTDRNENFSNKLCSFLKKNIKQSQIYVVDKQECIDKKYSNIIKIKNIDQFINLLNIEEG